MKELGAFDHWAFRAHAAPAEGLAIYRILFSTFLLLAIMPKFVWLAELPTSFHAPPPGPFALASSFPPAPVFIALELLLAVAAVSLLLGYRTRLASLGLGVTLMVGFGFVYSLGKINHGMLLLNIVPILLAFSPWGTRFSLDARRGAKSGDPGWPLAFMALLTGLWMLTAGVGKAVTGWLDPGTHAARAWIIKNLALDDRAPILADTALRIDSEFFWSGVDYLTVALEVGLVLTVFWPLAFRLMLAFFVFFHVGIYLTMGIAFGAGIIAYAAFVKWEGLFPRSAVEGRKETGAGLPRYTGVGVVATGGAYWVLHDAVGPPLGALWDALVPVEVGLGTAIPLLGGLVVAVAYIAILALSTIRSHGEVSSFDEPPHTVR